MSVSLYWSPPPTEIKEHGLDLKYEIGRYLDPDYNGGGDTWEVDKEIIPFLKGIIAAGTEGKGNDAAELIEAINKYGTVVLTIH